MQIDPSQLEPRAFYRQMVRAITPRPIAWVSSISNAGEVNLAPFSFFNGVSSNPPSVVFSPVNDRNGEPKHTLVNVRETGQFVLNIVTHDLREAMNVTAYGFDYGDSEFDAAGLTPSPCRLVKSPRVAEAAVAMECDLLQIVPVGTGPLAGNLVVGQIRLMHVADHIADEEGGIDPAKLHTIGRMGDNTYCTTRDRFDLPRPTRPEEVDPPRGRPA